MKNQDRFVSIIRTAALAVCLLLLDATALHAQDLLWDVSGVAVPGPAQDGSGVWDESTSSWFSYSPPLETWVDGATAQIGAGGTAGEITVSAPVTVGNINFQAVASGSYDLAADAAGDPLTLTGGATINVAVGGSASISCPLVGDFNIGTDQATLTINVTANAANMSDANLYYGMLAVVGGSTGNYGIGRLISNGNLIVSDNMQGPGHESVSNLDAQDGVIISAPTGGSIGSLDPGGYALTFVPGGSNAFGVLQIDGDTDLSFHSPVFNLDLNTTNAAIGVGGPNCANDYVNFTGNITGNQLNNETFNLNFVGPSPASGAVLTYTVLNYTGTLSPTPPTINVPANANVTSTQFGTNGAQYTITVTFGTATTPPTPVSINCPANITVADNEAGGGAIVNFPVTAGGGCTTPTVMTLPASGSNFPDGTTTVNCTAYDSCGDTNTCSFTVMVTPPASGPPSQTITSIVNNHNGSATLTYNATGGFAYDVQYTTGLKAPVTWITIPAGNTNVAFSGSISFTDPNAAAKATAAGGRIFYRTVSP